MPKSCSVRAGFCRKFGEQQVHILSFPERTETEHQTINNITTIAHYICFLHLERARMWRRL